MEKTQQTSAAAWYKNTAGSMSEKKAFLLNAFSLQMVELPCNVHFEEVESIPEGLISAVGHQDTANVLGVPMNRILLVRRTQRTSVLILF